ncbi:hypothetical protein SDJN02_21694 [Cucurbita argyrosperma subsp. argyrosperma]|nr:hypothetical protein SDJN02_21694 [Cucurbita argyrosperma subsp. argyrosperma]
MQPHSLRIKFRESLHPPPSPKSAQRPRFNSVPRNKNTHFNHPFTRSNTKVESKPTNKFQSPLCFIAVLQQSCVTKEKLSGSFLRVEALLRISWTVQSDFNSLFLSIFQLDFSIPLRFVD